MEQLPYPTPCSKTNPFLHSERKSRVMAHTFLRQTISGLSVLYSYTRKRLRPVAQSWQTKQWTLLNLDAGGKNLGDGNLGCGSIDAFSSDRFGRTLIDCNCESFDVIIVLFSPLRTCAVAFYSSTEPDILLINSTASSFWRFFCENVLGVAKIQNRSLWW